MTSHVESPDVDGDPGKEAEQLHRIQSVTEASLAHLEIDELLDTLLERTREILGADTAAVLLIDRGAGEMVATAAKGLERRFAAAFASRSVKASPVVSPPKASP